MHCLVKVSHQLTRLIASLFLQFKGDGPEDSDTEGALPSLSSREARRARFRSFLSFLAQYSDVEVKTKKLFNAARVIHLTSEDAPESEESIALTTTGALLQMFEAWWLEFKQKDGQSGSLQTKLRLLFKSSAARVSLKPYESGDGLLSFDPPDAPATSYAWLPAPPKRLEISEGDLLYFDRQARMSLRALNFVEVVLQTWKSGNPPEDTLTQMRHSLSRAVKCAIQAQIAAVGGLTQLRRDHYLSAAKGLSVDDLRELRHSPILGLLTLFPEASLRELNEKHHKALQTKALLQSTTKKETPKKAVPRPKQSYDNSQQTWCVSAPTCVFKSLASVVVLEDVRGSPGGTPTVLWMPVLRTTFLLPLL